MKNSLPEPSGDETKGYEYIFFSVVSVALAHNQLTSEFLEKMTPLLNAIHSSRLAIENL